VIVDFNYGFDQAIGTTAEATQTMFQEFQRCMDRWSNSAAVVE
jgi:hypothetical protein